MGPAELGQHGQPADAVGWAVALALLAMSVASWVVILAKWWLLRQARRTLAPAVAAFWAADSWEQAEQAVALHDAGQWLQPLVQAASEARQAASGLQQQAGLPLRVTRALRDALALASARLHWGQTLLATVGATAPFVGLLGTVWGIVLAMRLLAGETSPSLDAVAGPVGEALVMTAAGLAVAIPAVLGYNLLGRWAAGLEAQLDAFAHDVLSLVVPQGPGAAATGAVADVAASGAPAGRG